VIRAPRRVPGDSRAQPPSGVGGQGAGTGRYPGPDPWSPVKNGPGAASAPPGSRPPRRAVARLLGPPRYNPWVWGLGLGRARDRHDEVARLERSPWSPGHLLQTERSEMPRSGGVPVIAAGGIMDARGVVACLALGASAVQLGTAFLGCPEATVPTVWRDALVAAEAETTIVTEVLSGKPARAIRNRYIDELEAIEEPLLPYPAQYSVSRELRKEAVRRGDPSFVAMWAGQGVGLIRRQPAAELVNQLVTDSRDLMNRLARG
jgi:hypothetical protein